MKLTGEDYLKYFDDMNFNLYLYQRCIIKAWFEGKKLVTSRGLGEIYIDKLLQEQAEQRPKNLDITFDLPMKQLQDYQTKSQ